MWIKDYRLKNFIMFQDFENKIQYGINEDKQWFKDEYTRYKTSTTYEAKPEEIEKALRKEAKRRGFVEGVKFLGCAGDEKNQELTIDKIKFHTEFQGLHCGNSWIFLRGEWGTVVCEEKPDFNEDNVLSVKINPETEELFIWKSLNPSQDLLNDKVNTKSNIVQEALSKVSLDWFGDDIISNQSIGELYFYYKSEKHGANFYELIREIQTKVGEGGAELWKTFVIYKQLGSGLEFSREKEEFYNKFKQVYV